MDMIKENVHLAEILPKQTLFNSDFREEYLQTDGIRKSEDISNEENNHV